MTLLIGAVTIGFILSLLALGVLISFRIFAFPDITAEGSITLGASVAAVLLVNGTSPLLATFIAVIAGMAAGASTGVLHTKFKINGLLSGILVMTALYSTNLHVMGRSNIPLLGATTFVTKAEAVGAGMLGGTDINLFGWEVSARDFSVLVFSMLAAAFVGAVLYLFFRTDIGTAMRATGDNSQMIRALGVSDGTMIILGLAVSNGLVALAGALLAQYQGFADVQMGIGMMVWGLASVIIGEALVGVKQLGYAITGSVMGSVLFRLLVAIALRWGLDPNDLKLITAIFVFLALILPGLIGKVQRKKAAAHA
jgi:putative tryptophan/tyrosine transport system permease protein